MTEARLEWGFVPAAVLLALWGLFGSHPDPQRAAGLVAGAPGHEATEAWGLQTIEAVLPLRPWHPGYVQGRRTMRELATQRREAVSRG